MIVNYFLAFILLTWPILSMFNHTNNIIITFIFYTADIVTRFNQQRKTIYAEYTLVIGNPPNTILAHLWILCVIVTKNIELTAIWVAASFVHIYSPLYDLTLVTRLLGFYISLLVLAISKGIYWRCYRKWAVSYTVLSTNDAEMPVTLGQRRD